MGKAVQNSTATRSRDDSESIRTERACTQARRPLKHPEAIVSNGGHRVPSAHASAAKPEGSTSSPDSSSDHTRKVTSYADIVRRRVAAVGSQPARQSAGV